MHGFEYITEDYGVIQLGKKPVLLVDIIVLDGSSPSDKILYPNLKGFTLTHVRSYNRQGSTSPDNLLHSVITDTEPDGTPYVEYVKRSSFAKGSAIYVFASGTLSSLPNTQGILIRNQNQDVVVTEEAKNMAYFGEASYYDARTSITAADKFWDDFRFGWEFEFRIDGLDDRPPIAFIEPAGVSNEHFTLFAQEYLGNGTWRFIVNHHNANANDRNPGPAPSVHVFAEYDFFEKPSHGLELFKENGDLSFHTGNANPLQIEEDKFVLPPSAFNNSVALNLPSVQRPAYLFTGHTLKKERLAPEIGGVFIISTNIHVSAIRPTSYGVLCRPINIIESFGDDGPVRNRDETAVVLIDLNDYV